MDIPENKISATGGSTGNASAASLPNRSTTEPLSRPVAGTSPVTEDMRPATRLVIEQYSAAETTSTGTHSGSASATADMPSTAVKIDEDFLIERLGISDAKGLLRDLSSNGYIRNGEVADSFARLFGPQDKFKLSDAFKDIRSDVFYLLQSAYIHNISVKVKDENNRKIEAFEATFNSWWRRGLLFRDSALQRRYALADAYLNLAGKDNMDYYDKAVESAKEITTSLYNTNSRKPLFWHESIFLMSSANYSKGLQIWNHATNEKEIEDAKKYFRDGIKDLYIQYSNLNPMDSYLSAYCSQLLDVCANYYELTGEQPYFMDDNGNSVAVGLPEIRAIFSKAKISNGFWDTGFEGFVNRLTDNFMGNISKYMDYYLAAKIRINYARYCIAESGSGSAETEDLTCEAVLQIQDALDVIDDIRSAPNNLKARWAIYNSGLFGGIREIYRGATGEGTNFVKAFGLYAALGHRVSSLQNLKKHNYQKALTDIEMAYAEISERREDAGSSFYLGGWEIKEAYFMIMSDYLDILMSTENNENSKKAANLALGWLSDETLSSNLEDQNPRLYTKLQMIAATFGQKMPERTDDFSETQDQPAAGLGPWDFHDFALSDMFGLRKVWSERRTVGLWTETVNNLLNIMKNPNNLYVADKDRPLLLARSYAWLGNLMKWADEGKTDPAVEQQIIELAKGLAQTDGEKAVAGTREGAIMMLYKTALEQFAEVSEKPLYLEAEEASTKYQLADLAQGILEDKEASEALKAAAAKTLENNFMQTAMTGLQGIIDSAEGAKEPEIAVNALVSYADSLASGISDLLAAGEPEKAYDEAAKQFTVMVEAAANLPKSDALIEFCDKSECKFYYNDAGKTLVVRGKMTPEDKAALESIFTSDADRKAIETLFISSRHSLSVETLGKTVHDKEGSIPALLTVANALISKAFAENDNNGPITRIMVSEIADMAEAQILSKHPDPSAATEAVQTQLADIAALRLYVLMGNTPAERSITNEEIEVHIKHETKEDGSTAPVISLTIRTSGGKEVEVADVFMQQKLKLALISIWIRNNTWTKDSLTIAREWAGSIEEKGLNAAFRLYARGNSLILRDIEAD